MLYSNNLKYLREEKEIKQEELAKYLNITQSVYSHYETEYYIIPIKYLNSICNYFNVSLDYILGFTNLKSYQNSKSEINKNIIGSRLKEFRKKENLTQDSLGKILNTSKSLICDYEKGRAIIATPFLYTICNKYNISADYILGKIDNPIYYK